MSRPHLLRFKSSKVRLTLPPSNCYFAGGQPRRAAGVHARTVREDRAVLPAGLRRCVQVRYSNLGSPCRRSRSSRVHHLLETFSPSIVQEWTALQQPLHQSIILVYCTVVILFTVPHPSPVISLSTPTSCDFCFLRTLIKKNVGKNNKNIR